MMFKVYAKNITRPKGMRIIHATSSDLDEAVQDVLNYAMDVGMVDGSNLDAAYDKIYNYYEKNHVLNAGDWMITDAESIDDIVIPNMCGNDASLIF